MPQNFQEIVRHDLNTALNEFISYSAVWFVIEWTKTEGMIFNATDSDIVTALKSAGLQVSTNEVIRLLKRMGYTLTFFK